jgi:hypothetical protein
MRRYVKTLLILGVSILVGGLISGLMPLKACMVAPPDYRGIIGHSAKEAVIFFDKGREELILRVDYKINSPVPLSLLRAKPKSASKIGAIKPPSRVAWVITVPNEPDAYAVADNKLFENFYWYTQPTDPFAAMMTGGGVGGLEVGKEVIVGPYSIQPVHAVGREALAGLNKWLLTNGFSPEDEQHTRYFVDNNFTFLCVKVIPPPGKESLGPGGDLPPIQLSFKTPRPYVPLKFGSHDGPFNVRLYFLSKVGLDYVASSQALTRINWKGTDFESSPWNQIVQVKPLKNMVHFVPFSQGVFSQELINAYTKGAFKNDRSAWRLNVIEGAQVNTDNSIASWDEDIFFQTLSPGKTYADIQAQILPDCLATTKQQEARGNYRSLVVARAIARAYGKAGKPADAEQVSRWIDLCYTKREWELSMPRLPFSNRPKYEWPSLAQVRSDKAENLRHLGILCKQQGKLSDAASAFQQQVDLLQKSNDPTNWRVAEGRGYIGLIYADQGQAARGEALLKSELAKFEKDPRLRVAANKLRGFLGLVYVRQGKYAEADPLMKIATEDSGFLDDYGGENEYGALLFAANDRLLRSTHRTAQANDLAAKRKARLRQVASY